MQVRSRVGPHGGRLPLAGFQTSAGFDTRGFRWTAPERQVGSSLTSFLFANSSSPNLPSSRPTPELFTPPNDFSEESIGTNGLGTPMQEGSAVFVRGAAHFNEALESLACAGVGIRHPVTGRVIGSLSLAAPWTRPR